MTATECMQEGVEDLKQGERGDGVGHACLIDLMVSTLPFL